MTERTGQALADLPTHGPPRARHGDRCQRSDCCWDAPDIWHWPTDDCDGRTRGCHCALYTVVTLRTGRPSRLRRMLAAS